MKTQAYIDYRFPDEHFWDSYSLLWHNSSYQSAFQSPYFIRQLAESEKPSLAIYKYLVDGKLMGAVFFKSENGVYRFLSDKKTDHNFFVIHKECTSEGIKTFFENFLKEVKAENWALILNSQPAWASYMPALLATGKTSRLYWETSKVAVCPVFEAASPEALNSRLRKSRTNRYKMNRLKKEQEAVFEEFTDDEDLDNWVDAFCKTHVKRWKGTSTPSAFQSEEKRRFLSDCLHAWAKDNILVRFSARVGDERIAFCIGLIQENSLIYHSLTYDPEYSKYSPGKVLILFLGQWMERQNLNVLDFGHGDEPYKYRYANKELELNSIFISNNWNLPFILRAKIIKAVRENPGLINSYRKQIRPRLARFIN